MPAYDDALMQARLYMRANAPYFSRALLGMIPHPEPRIPTLAVTPGMVLLFNPAYLLSLTEKQAGTVLWHEAQHVLRKSFDRLKGVDEETANICEDLAINTTARHNACWEFPPGVLLPAKYNLPEDLTAEEYYRLLPDNAKADASGACCGQCGSAAGGSSPSSKEIEKEADALYGRTEVDVDLIRLGAARDIVNHEKFAGKVPGKWSEWANKILEPSKVSWEVYFHNLVRTASSRITQGDADYSIMHPSRRIFAMPPGPFRPGLVGHELEFAIIIDTSGSMDIQKHIRPALREARGAVLASGCDRCWFLQGDADVSTKPVRISAQNLVDVEIKGRGGTDFRVPIAAAMKLRPKPNLILYYTDGFGPAPQQQPAGTEFIWVVVEGGKPPVSWGSVVYIPR